MQMYKTGPFNSHFPSILIAALIATVRSFRHARDKNLWGVAIGTQLVCVVNLQAQSVLVQTLCHDLFVYVILNSLLHTHCYHMRRMGVVLSIAQLATRAAYNRCIFLWWNESRNILFDICVFVITIIGARRTKSLISVNTCAAVAAMTHFVDDSHRLDPVRSLWNVAVFN